jgi:dTMP kinase
MCNIGTSNHMEGRFIVLEGPDGSGTTRHSQFLASRLRALVTSEPTESMLGVSIRSFLKQEGALEPETLQLLFSADRAEHVATVIEPALTAGQTVVSDRYTLSTIVYGAAMGVDAEWLRTINKFFPKPDLTIITLPPFEICMSRIGTRTDRDAFETEMLQKRIYEGYRSIEDPSIIFVDTSGEKEDVADVIEKEVLERFPELAHPISSLEAV